MNEAKRYFIQMKILNPYHEGGLNKYQVNDLSEAEDIYRNAIETARILSGGSEHFPDGMDVFVQLVDTEGDKPRILKSRFISEAEGLELELDPKEDLQP